MVPRVPHSTEGAEEVTGRLRASMSDVSFDTVQMEMLSLAQLSVAEPLRGHGQPNRPLNPAASSGQIRSGC